MKKVITILVLIIISCCASHAQSVGLGTYTPSPSAILDVVDSTRGILIPRLDSTHRVNISSPALGLMVFDTTSKAFWYYNGSAWSKIGSGSGGGLPSQISDADSNTTVTVEKNPNENIIRFTLNGTEAWVMKGKSLAPRNTNNSIFIGLDAGSNSSGNYNTIMGDSAFVTNTLGNENTASGFKALYSNSSGSENVAVGNGSLTNNVNGSLNTAVGYLSLSSNTSGNLNTAIGLNALRANVGGSSNTAGGVNSLFNNSSGSNNVAYGNESLKANSTGSSNTSAGYNSMYLNITGSNNTAIGFNAMVSNKTGSNNTVIGSLANTSDSLFTNSTALGYNTIVDASNKVRIGNPTVGSIGGQVGWTTFSDGRFKKDVQENVEGLDFIRRLRPVTYIVDIEGLSEFYSHTKTNACAIKSILPRQFGFIAQEVEKTAAQLGFVFSGVDHPGNDKALYGLRYADFVVPLVKAVQEQETTIGELKEEIELLKKEISIIKNKFAYIKYNNTSQ